MTDDTAPFSFLEAPKTQGLKTLESAFEEWLRTARGGQRFVYCTRHCLDLKTSPEVQAVALQAREAYATGLVELIQKRTKKDGLPIYRPEEA